MSPDKQLKSAILAVGVLFVALASTSCSSIGAGKVVSTHTTYNDAVQLTITREVLTNVVRSRYSDPMTFIAVGAINAQFSVNVGASGGVGGIGEGASGQAGGSVGYSDSPTITYVPQTDAAFYKSMYEVFDVGEAIGFGFAYRYAPMDSAWKALSVRFSFTSINGVHDFYSGRRNELYDRRVKAFARLLQTGATFQQIPEWDFDTTAFPKGIVTAEEWVAAFTRGFSFIEEDDGENVRLARYRLVIALTLPDPDDPAVVEALETLGVTPGRSRYVLRPPTHSAPGATDPYAIWVTPRSMSDAINLATRFVEVPEAHAAMVPSLGMLLEDSPIVSKVRIRSAKEEPPFPYRVQHRGYWFYVDDTEIESKMFLEALVAMYSSRIGSRQAGDKAPQMVLPVGG